MFGLLPRLLPPLFIRPFGLGVGFVLGWLARGQALDGSSSSGETTTE